MINKYFNTAFYLEMEISLLYENHVLIHKHSLNLSVPNEYVSKGCIVVLFSLGNKDTVVKEVFHTLDEYALTRNYNTRKSCHTCRIQKNLFHSLEKKNKKTKDKINGQIKIISCIIYFTIMNTNMVQLFF